jgi:hypothetical protein
MLREFVEYAESVYARPLRYEPARKLLIFCSQEEISWLHRFLNASTLEFQKLQIKFASQEQAFTILSEQQE